MIVLKFSYFPKFTEIYFFISELDSEGANRLCRIPVFLNSTCFWGQKCTEVPFFRILVMAFLRNSVEIITKQKLSAATDTNAIFVQYNFYGLALRLGFKDIAVTTNHCKYVKEDFFSV